MPTYEYECEACGHRFEARQPITADPLKQCPACRGRVHRVLSGGSGFILKGAASECSLERKGRTCCGRDERCRTPQCERE